MYACVNEACGGVCTPGAVQCTSGTDYQTCGMNGQWGAAAACPYACISNRCTGVCAPGSVECVGSDATHQCGTDGQWGPTNLCDYICTGNGQCGDDEKYAFVSSVLFKATMGGLSGADQACQNLASAAMLPGDYLAWLSDDRESPATRFKRRGPYRLVNKTPIAKNWTGLTSGSLMVKLNMTELGGSPPATVGVACGIPTTVWTATDYSGNARVGQNCDGWTSTAPTNVVWGDSDSIFNWSLYCSGGSTTSNACGSMSPIYCFQQ
jgi:hypothetical protein